MVKVDANNGIDEIHKPGGNWQEHGADKFHESEGGRDMFGRRPQDGQDIWTEEILALNSEMGMLTSIIIVVALAVDFLFLPPFLMAFDRKNIKQELTDE